MFERKKVGLALSGGGVRGFAHLGVLHILEDYNIPIDMISGTSIGAIIGAMYAAEPNAKKLEKEILAENIGSLLDYTLSTHGLIKGEKIENYLKKRLKNITFKDLKIPLFITSFDLEKKREVIFTKGDVARAVRASISVPGLFIPVENKNEILIDAGIIDPIPTEILKAQGADIIIAVNVNNFRMRKPLINDEAVISKQPGHVLPTMMQATTESMNIIGSQAAKADLAGNKADFIIDIDLEDITLLDYKKTKKAIEAGKRATKKSISKILSLEQATPLKDLLSQLDTKIDKKVKKIVRKVKERIKEDIK